MGLYTLLHTGVVVRAIAPFIESKTKDPAVVVVDVGGRWAVSLLSGHEGGANDLAITVANAISAEPIITTTTEALKTLIVGVGCRRGTTSEKIVAAIKDALTEADLEISQVRLLSSAEIKSDEQGLLQAARELGLPLRFISSDEIREFAGNFEHSDFVREKVNLPAVAEPAALMAGRRTRLVPEKKDIQRSDNRGRQGKLFVVGIGPGDPLDRTRRAEQAIEQSSVIVGYKRYLELIKDLTAGKELVSSGMTREKERCRAAIERAEQGAVVALISSGDAGIYGMAGLALEMAKTERKTIPIEIVPGVTSATASAAKLGAPLMLDFACISLSDLLVPWDVIRKRLEAVAAADLVTALYNPRSKKRTAQLDEAAAIFRKYREGDVPVGICTAVGTEDEQITLTSLDQLLDHEINMRSIVIVGNRSSKIIDESFHYPARI